jgi:PAS domain S-box-containing protein
MLSRYRYLYDAAPVGLVTLDGNGSIVEGNERAAAMFGLEPAAMRGKRLAALLPPAGSAAVEGLQARTLGSPAVIEIRWPDPGTGAAERTAQLEAARDADSLSQLVVLTDVTERKRAEAALHEARAISSATRMRSEFLARIGHELRTPLNAVLGFSELLLSDTQAPLEHYQAAWVGHVAKAGRHLLQLVDDVMDISKVEAGHAPLKLSELDLVQLTQECVPLMLPAAQAGRVEILQDPSSCASCLVQADAKRVRQVVLNVLTNAIKYNVPGGTVRWRVELQPHKACLVVRDTGIGMTPEQQAHLFEPFNRLGAEGTPIEGAGLGLVICRLLMEAMRGTIELSGQQGEGTTVRLTLPLAQATSGS